MSETPTADSEPGTCEVTSADLDIADVDLKILDLSLWNCSRSVWDDDRCVWHADATDKPPEELAATIEDGELHGAQLSGVDLSEGSVLSGARLVDADLSNARLAEADLSDAVLHEADLSDADLYEADLSNADLHDADFSNADLHDTDLSQTDLYEADLSEADLPDVDLSEADLRRADLSNAVLYDADLSPTDLYEADLSNADLHDADLSNARLAEADLSNARLGRADLSEADLPDADLSNARLGRADLSEADLPDADLTDAALAKAEVAATLERANLTRTDLFDADLRGAAFYGAVTTDTQLNEQTGFGDHYTAGDQSVGDDDSQQARWCLRRVEQLAEENALPDQSREAFLQRREIRRREARTEGNWGEWTLLTIVQAVMGYGESFVRVLRTAAVIVLCSALLYPVWGVETTAGERLAYPPILGAATAPLEYTAALGDTLLTSLYFSVLTFTTLGFGDLQPVGLGRALATFEAGAGVTLFALLVFVLGRRSTR